MQIIHSLTKVLTIFTYKIIIVTKFFIISFFLINIIPNSSSQKNKKEEIEIVNISGKYISSIIAKNILMAMFRNPLLIGKFGC